MTVYQQTTAVTAGRMLYQQTTAVTAARMLYQQSTAVTAGRMLYQENTAVTARGDESCSKSACVAMQQAMISALGALLQKQGVSKRAGSWCCVVTPPLPCLLLRRQARLDAPPIHRFQIPSQLTVGSGFE
jgi:hypothetical protein